MRRAINRGSASINELCQKYLGKAAEHFLIDEVPEPFNLFKYVASARDEWIRSRAGRHKPEPELFFSAYKKIRDAGFGYRVLMIDESPEAISAMKHCAPVLDWFQDSLGFENKQSTGLEDLLYSWQPEAGVRVFGNAAPVRSRIKILDSDSGQLRYSSILMKMLLKGFFPDSITDYSGVEMIVADDAARNNLVNYFRKNVGALSKLEGFKEQKGSPASDNPNSSDSFKVVKFRLHVPVCAEYIEAHPLGRLANERIPVEVQILTLEDDYQRKFNPDVTHEQYKERQFKSVFPALFPKEIYLPLLQLRHV